MAEKQKPKSELQTNENGSNIFLLFDDITNESAHDVCEWILGHNITAEGIECLNLIVNSTGGSLYDAYAIIDIMQSSNIPVRTIGLGQIQSAGLMVFLAGAKGQRILTPNTSIMSHQYSWGSEGKHKELVAIQREFDMTYERMVKHYMKHTKMTRKNVEKYLLPSEDVFLSADDALKFGICDKVANL